MQLQQIWSSTHQQQSDLIFLLYGQLSKKILPKNIALECTYINKGEIETPSKKEKL